MGFIKAFGGALSGTFADQWKDFYAPKQGVAGTAALFPAVAQGQNAGRGENTKGNENIITNGSKIIVPEGTALITIQDGQITGFISEPGGFEFKSDDPNSKSIFSGDGLLSSTIGSSWEKFKFGGQAASQQLAFYVNLKEIPGNKFGTSEIVYWNDSYLDLKAGGMARGTYSLKIVDPLLFVKNFVPQQYLQPNAPIFDFADMENAAGEQLFNEYMTCISGAVARFSQQAKAEDTDTMEFIQGNQDKFALSMAEEVNNTYQWEPNRGLKVVSVSIQITYDEKTQQVLDEIRADDREIRKAKRMGEAYQNNMVGMMASASGEAMKNAAANENGAMMGFMGMNMAQQSGGNMLGAVQNMATQQPVQPTQAAQPVANSNTAEASPTDKLLEMKKLLDAGAITQEDYDKVKNQVLGI